jgi:predicted RND superfamily exporter protein
MAPSHFTHTWVSWVIKNPRWTLLLLVVLTLAAAAGLPRFKLDASADSLTLEADKDLDYFRQVSKQYNSGDFLVVTYTPKQELFSDASLEHLNKLQAELAAIEGVETVNSILNVPLLYSPKQNLREIAKQPRTLLSGGQDQTPTDRTLAKQEFLTSPIYRELILSPDGQTTALQLNLQVDKTLIDLVSQRDALLTKRQQAGLNKEETQLLEQVAAEYLQLRTAADARSHARVAKVREVVGRYKNEAQIFVGGLTMITADMVDYIRSDLMIFGTASFLFMVLILAVLFRNLRYVLIPIASCVMSIVIMLGFLAWIDWRLTVISSNFVALLMIISLTVTIHLVMRYREYVATHPTWSREQLIMATLSFMAMPSWNNTLTTVVAFASFVTSGIRPLIDFGWMMSIGLMVALVLSFVTLPAFLMLLPKDTAAPAVHPLTKTRRSISALCGVLVEKCGPVIFWGGLILGGLSFWGIAKLEVENRFIDYFHADTEIHQGLSLIDNKLGGTTSLDIIITPKPASSAAAADADPFADPEKESDPFSNDEDAFADGDPLSENDAKTSVWMTVGGMEYVQKIHDYLESLPEVGKVQSLATLYKVGKDINGSLNNFELALMEKSLPEPVSRVLFNPYLDKSTDQTRITLRVKDSYPGLKRAELIDRIRTHISALDGMEIQEVRYSRLLVLYNNMLQSLYTSQIATLGWSFVVIFIMFLVLLRSFLLSVVATVPTAISAAVMLGGMGFAGIPLDMMTITIASITVGIGVDNTIHYLHRFEEELQKDGDYLATMHRCHASIGHAIYHTNNIIVFGFSIMVLSSFIPTIYFGALTGVAMMVALAGTMFFLPQFILMIKPFKVFKPAA